MIGFLRANGLLSVVVSVIVEGSMVVSGTDCVVGFGGFDGLI
jgi:hypothetical protein